MFSWLKSSLKTSPANEADKPVAEESPRDRLIAEALANARTAREAIGPERLEKLRTLMEKKNQPMASPMPVTEARSPMEQAKKILQQLDTARMTDTMRALHEQHK